MDLTPFYWHAASVDECLRRLDADPQGGLDPAEAARRLARHGRNEIPAGAQRGPLRILAAQFRDFIMWVLAFAAVVAGLVGDVADTVVILVIIVLNAAIGFVQEYRAERAIAALRQLAAPTARVRRGGAVMSLAAAALVPGDVVELEAGDIVPADLRVLGGAQLRADESALTGESQPVDKAAGATVAPAAPIGDRGNMAWKGTLAVHGRASGVVVATGLDTELGRIATLLASAEDLRTPLQRRLTRFGRQLSLAVLAVCAIMFVAGLQRGEPVLLMFMTAVALAVAAIPEALPAVVTVTLALGARRMARARALVRHLPSVETLGGVTVICSDKTGTLTLNQMSAERFWAGGAQRDALEGPLEGSWRVLAEAMALNNDARSADGRLAGDPTETALLRAARAAGIDRDALGAQQPRVAELPFDSVRKRMLTVHRLEDGSFRLLAKGAPEAVLELCADAPPGAAQAAEALAAEGLRVLAFAERRIASLPASLEALEADLRFIGLAGLLDPPRPEAAAAVSQARAAGIRTVMVTGDHAVTAHAIAARLGIDEVHARVAPEQKLTLVRELQARGECVAVTGDGVNDAPALKQADIGVAMGRGGTDVAREAADLVLQDDNFATIVRAVREGRRIYDNIRRFVRYGLTTNSGEIWTLFLAPFLGLPLPLLPIQILWINLVTDGLPGLALAAEPAEREVMRRPPRPLAESLFAHGLGAHVIWVGLLMGGLAIAVQAWAVAAGNPNWQTIVFTALTLMQMAHVLAIRSERDSLFTQDPRANPALPAAVALTLVLQLAAVYVPALQPLFGTRPLTAGELALCFALAALVFFAVEGEKALMRRDLLYARAL